MEEKMKERFAQLPQVVQEAITSSEVEKHLRALSDANKLHIDQWQLLENEVVLALLGMEEVSALEKNIAAKVGVPAEVARSLAEDITKVVFEPIRAELEQSLGHPQPEEKVVTAIDAVAKQAISQEHSSASPEQKKAPITVTRAPISPAYKPSEPSSARKVIDGDPYREPIA